MTRLVRGMWDVLFPVEDGKRYTSRLYMWLLVVLPLLAGVVWFLLDTYTALALKDPGVVAASFGVLGGLLFAHAIFVFQLRISYDAAHAPTKKTKKVGPPQTDARVRPLIDETFNGVLYAFVVALILTMLSAFLAATQDPDASVPTVVASVIIVIAVHLFGCVNHIINATVSAYSSLKARPH